MLIDIGKTLTMDVDVSKLQGAAMDHVIKIGLRNILMDAHASVTADEFPDATQRRDAALAKAGKKLEALYRGEVRANAVTRQSSLTPIEKEARRLAVEYVSRLAGKWEKDDGHALALLKMADIMGMPADTDDQKKAVFAAAIKRRASRDDVIAQAEKNVAAAEKLNAAVDVEL